MAQMDPDTDILLDCSPLFRQYKSGRIERLVGTDVVPAALDPATGVTSKDVIIDPDTNVSARLYLPKLTDSLPQKKLPILIYIHGGAFCTGSAFNPNPFLNSLVAKARLLAVSVDYRLAPEHSLPAAYDDCWAALKWAVSHASGTGPDPWLTEHADFSRVFVLGESAGANIAHDMAMRAGAEKLEFEAEIEGVILGHPYFWGTEPVGAETTNPAIRARIEGLWRLSNKEKGVSVDDPRFNPMAEGAPSLAGLGCRRLMVCVAEKDMLAERGKAYFEAVKRSGWGGEVKFVHSEEEDHVFFYMKPECAKALELMEIMVAFFKRKIGSPNGQHAKLASRMDATAKLSPRFGRFGNKDTRIRMKLSKINYHPNRPKVNMGETTHNSSNFHCLTKSASSNFHVMFSNLLGI